MRPLAKQISSVAIDVHRVRALVPVSQGACMHRMASKPRLAQQAFIGRVSAALEGAREEILRRQLENPQPGDRWVREIWGQAKQFLGTSFTAAQEDNCIRRLVTREVGAAIANSLPLCLVWDSEFIQIVRGSHVLSSVCYSEPPRQR